MTISELQAAAAALWALVGTWLKSIFRHTIYMSIIGGKYEKSIYTGLGDLSGYTGDCEMGGFMLVLRNRTK